MSDGELMDEIIIQIRNRHLEQKFLYMDNWANIYYMDKYKNKDYDISNFSYNDLFDIWIFWNINIDQKVAMISLWCWDSFTESVIFKNIPDYYNNIDYFAIDSSKKMLELSMINFKELNIKKKFICSDFWSNIFRRELGQMTDWYDKRIFTFFSNTFGNIEPTNMVDILYNLLKKWESIWLDVRIRAWVMPKDDMEAIWFYWKYIENDFISYPFCLKQIWIPKENGHTIMTTSKWESISSLKILYSFVFEKKTVITIKNETITILPWEKIDLLQIYTYEKQWFVNFFEQHWFKLIKEKIKELRWMFLFEKL